VSFDFAGPKIANEGFKPMVRENVFEAGELAIVTYLQAKAYGKPFVLLPAPIVSRSQHQTIGFDPRYGMLKPKDIEGRHVGVRTYAQTTGLWVRGILKHEYGVDIDSVTWMTADDAHLAEHVDPQNCERIAPGEKIDRMLSEGRLAAAVLGDKLPADLLPLIPDPYAAAEAWSRKTGVQPLNHLFVVRAELSRERPDVVREIYRLIVESREAAPEKAPDLAPFGVEPNRNALQLAIDWSVEQKMIPRSFEVDELFDDVTRTLGR
jgi:4,5-dihydroxyphthalate decarboxylase